MSTGYDTQLTRQIGEHLTVSKLGRLGIIATPFAGNVPEFDIIASDLKGNFLPIQVKTINRTSWQFKITTFLDIEFIKNNYQKILGKKQLNNPSLICVFIKLNENENDDFYILELKKLQEYFYKNYKGGIRPKNPKSIHCAIWQKDLEKYKNNWDLITSKIK